jgi:hypothetical protein
MGGRLMNAPWQQSSPPPVIVSKTVWHIENRNSLTSDSTTLTADTTHVTADTTQMGEFTVWTPEA